MDWVGFERSLISGEPRKLIYCRDAVKKLSRKYHARSLWIWEVIEDEFNLDRGDGALLTQEEMEELESIISDYMAE